MVAGLLGPGSDFRSVPRRLVCKTLAVRTPTQRRTRAPQGVEGPARITKLPRGPYQSLGVEPAP
jgi:hypothetical protein